MNLAERSGWEIALFAVLLALSIGLFLRRFVRVVRVIWRSKPDSDFQLAPLLHRLTGFFWQVVCQAKVIKYRPLAGLAHALVFWGFCAFSLVSVNHTTAPLPALPSAPLRCPVRWPRSFAAGETRVRLKHLALGGSRPAERSRRRVFRRL